MTVALISAHALLCRQRATVAVMATTKPNLLVIAGADSPELKVLDSAKGEVNIVATGRNLEELSHLTTEDWSSIDVVLNCGALPDLVCELRRAATSACF